MYCIDSDTESLWERLVDSGEISPLVTEDDLEYALENTPGMREFREQMMTQKDQPVFPDLTAKQREFAVNPAYKSFYDPRFKDIDQEENEGEILNKSLLCSI